MSKRWRGVLIALGVVVIIGMFQNNSHAPEKVGTSAPGAARITTVANSATPLSATPVPATPLSATPLSATPLPATPEPPASTGGSGSAAAALQALPVQAAQSHAGYSRALFGQAWSDDNSAPLGHNGCDTRNDILGRDLASVVWKPGTRNCVVASGDLHDPYTGKAIHFVRGNGTSTLVQIDHVVALADAWGTGAQRLTADERTTLANDPLELLAVDGAANQEKSDADAAKWLPQASFACRYVALQIAVKAKYRLWVTGAEKAAMSRVLGECSAQALAIEPGGEG